jgi:hypothetical protein
MRNGETKASRAPADFTFDSLAWFANGTKLVASGFSNSDNVPSLTPELIRSRAERTN